jgi:protein-S-isoprenylcysteine O-methyltransferase Ste14
MAPKYAIVFFWFVWLVSWGTAASWTKPTVKAAGLQREWPYRVLQGVGFALLFISLGKATSADPIPPLRAAILAFSFAQLWELPQAALWGMAVLTAAGFAFMWWGRLHLGEFWSSAVTRKEDHKVIDSGPYAFVRHPIYAGLLASSFALTAISGRTLAVIGFVLIAVGMYLKARLEERFLSAELGAEAYAAYAKRVPMLVPGSPV